MEMVAAATASFVLLRSSPTRSGRSRTVPRIARYLLITSIIPEAGIGMEGMVPRKCAGGKRPCRMERYPGSTCCPSPQRGCPATRTRLSRTTRRTDYRQSILSDLTVQYGVMYSSRCISFVISSRVIVPLPQRNHIS